MTQKAGRTDHAACGRSDCESTDRNLRFRFYLGHADSDDVHLGFGHLSGGTRSRWTCVWVARVQLLCQRDRITRDDGTKREILGRGGTYGVGEKNGTFENANATRKRCADATAFGGDWHVRTFDGRTDALISHQSRRVV